MLPGITLQPGAPSKARHRCSSSATPPHRMHLVYFLCAGVIARALFPHRGEPVMKRIEALIRPEKLHEVAEALIAAGVEDFNASEVRGVGRQHRQKMYYRGIEYTVEFVTRTRLDVLVADALRDGVVEAILAAARTGAAGDGIIVVQNYADAICLEDAGPADTGAPLPADEPADVPEEPVLSHRGWGVAALITTLTKLLGLAGARWHDLFP